MLHTYLKRSKGGFEESDRRKVAQAYFGVLIFTTTDTFLVARILRLQCPAMTPQPHLVPKNVNVMNGTLSKIDDIPKELDQRHPLPTFQSY